MGRLTAKQEMFCRQYLIDLNATQAAIRAEYSPKTAEATASRLLRNVKVQEFLKVARDDMQKRLELTADDVVRQLSKIAMRDIKDFVDWGKDGTFTLKAADEIDGTIVDAIQEDITDFGEYQKINRSVKFPDRMKALELLGRHLGLWNDKLKVDLRAQVVFTNEPPDDD